MIFKWLFKKELSPEMVRILNGLFWYPFCPDGVAKRIDYNQITAGKISDNAVTTFKEKKNEL